MYNTFLLKLERLSSAKVITGADGLDRKVSRGVTYLILKNTLNGFARPSVAYMVPEEAKELVLIDTELGG